MALQHKKFSPVLVLVALAAMAWSPVADAQRAPIRVQGPARSKVSKQRAAKVAQARRQRVRPEAVAKLGTRITKAVIGGKALSESRLRSELSIAPLQARLSVFKNVAKSRGLEVQTFTRRLRGMLKNGKSNRVVKSSKTFFEVLPETRDLFRESLGQNVIWFAASAAPNHLHTLLADQGNGTNLTHNTYGGALDTNSVSRTQYIAPAQLDNAQMARFTKYLNAGGEAGRRSVYGFKNSRGKWIYETTCTNWATSAPIGDLVRWAKTVDGKIARAAKSGELGPQFKDGLHSALASAPDAAARKVVLDKALKAPGLSKWSRSAARRLGKEFDVILKNFPSRPAELVARQTLSEIMGLSRSQDPAKWMYDLVMSKSVPLVGVMAATRNPNFNKMGFDLQIMGKINAQGEVVKGSYWGNKSLGVIPADRRAAPPVAGGVQ